MNVLVEMLVNGLPVKKINYNGDTYLPVCAGDVFSLRITNNTSNRIKCAVSVDGLSIMDGKPASYNSAGYIVDANDRIVIKGYRRGDSEVREFVVSDSASYAEKRTGSASNNGVIGVCITPEKVIRKAIRSPVSLGWDEAVSRGGEVFTSSCCSDACRGVKSFNQVGTAMGNTVRDEVYEVDFAEDATKRSIVKLYYDTVEGLRSKGVPVHVGANPFPAEQSQYYCPDA